MGTLRSIRVYDDVLRREVANSRTLKQQLQPLAANATRLAKAVTAEKGIKRRSGSYLSGFHSRVGPPSGRAIATIVTENTSEHAEIIEKGSPRHEITGNPLRFYWERKKKPMRIRRVNHPGTKAYRVIETAMKRLARGG